VGTAFVGRLVGTIEGVVAVGVVVLTGTMSTWMRCGFRSVSSSSMFGPGAMVLKLSGIGAPPMTKVSARMLPNSAAPSDVAKIPQPRDL
jgi:hypothetical protein